MSSSGSDSPTSTNINHGPAKLTWEIEDFSTTNIQRSAKFYFPENSKCQFMLECSPNVEIAGKVEKFVVFDLCFEPLNRYGRFDLFAKPWVRFRITILATNGIKYFSQECQNKFIYPYNNPFGVIGGCQIKRDYLLDQANGLLINDKLTIYCEVDDNCLKKSLPIPVNPKLDDFRSLLESGKFSDAVLLIDGKSLFVHKNILASRSEVFEAMFDHDLEEKKTNRVQITDVLVEVFELMLGYIYTGKIPRMCEYAAELFVAADKYQLNILRKSCENHLMNNLTSSSAANILLISDMHQAHDLKTKCMTYISKNVKQVLCTDGWKVLLTKADLMAELLSKMVDKHDEKVRLLEIDIKILKKRALLKLGAPQSNLKLTSRISEKLSSQNLNDEIKLELQLAENLFDMKIVSLLDNGKFSDAFLIVGDEELSIHRNILSARSKVFADLFETQTRVQVDNISVEACKELLRYIYTGQVGSNGNEFAPQLLEASNKYQLNHLKVICEEFLSSSIDLDSVVNKFLLADSNEADYLKRNCFDFICENVSQVINTEA